jgi:hypothetical protein
MSKHSGFNLSNVDMLACGLGACILLMLAFIVNISGTGTSKGLSSGNKDNIAMAALISPDEIKEGKMVFVRSVEIQFPKVDYNSLKASFKSSSLGDWLYDGKNVNEIDYVEQQIILNDKDYKLTYLIKSDSVLPNRITYNPNSLFEQKSSTFGQKGEGYSISARILEGAINDSKNEEITTGMIPKKITLNNLKDLESVVFLRKPVKGKTSLEALIEFNTKQ